MKKLLTLLAAAMLAVSASAIPARRGFRTVTNSDGRQLTISLVGDETFHYHVTSDGVPVRQNAQGDWVVDTRDVTSLWRQASARRNAHRKQLAQKLRRSKAPLRAGETSTSSKRGLLILVNFHDVKFVNSDAKTKEIFVQMLNGIDNPYGKNHGSVREYFREQSYGQFDIEFDVLGPVTVSKDMAYYGANDSNGDDVKPGEMVAEALKLVDSQVDFHHYDWDGDGEVENIYVTYAGFGEAVDGADENTIWPHQWQLSDPANYGSSLKLDDVTVDTYACGSELMGISGTTLDGIGTMCHEYSHCLGLPDFYDTTSSGSNFGMYAWSIMDYGCYNGDGFFPAGYTAYERWFSGWLEPEELNSAVTINDMPNIEENPVAYIVYNDQNHNEYYLLENHQKKGWDAKAPGHGLLVVHVDYDENAWYNNTVNNVASRQRMTIIPADNKATITTASGDPFPNGGKATELTDTSTPVAKLYRANTDGQKLMHKPITDITEAGGKISFAFMGGKATIATPVAESDVTKLDLTSTGFTARWSAVEGVASYNLRLTEKDDEGGNADADRVLAAINLIEDFENFFVDESKTSDGSSDISKNISTYTNLPGWGAEKVYQGVYGAKLGTGSAIGYLITPPTECTTGELTVYVEAWDWFNYSTYENTGTYKPDGSSVEVSLLDEDDNELQSQTVAAADLLEGNYLPVFHFSNVPSVFCIKVSTVAMKKRIYLSYLICFDGSFTDDEVDTIWEEEEAAPHRQLNSSRNAVRRAPRRAPGDTQTLTGITDTHYVFTGLTPGTTYTWQVQAVAEDGSLSGWSNLVELTLPEGGEDAIGSLKAEPRSSVVFDLAGRRMAKDCLLRPGIYIVDGRKVVVR